MEQRIKKRTVILFIVFMITTLSAVLLFLVWGLNERNIDYNLPRRLVKVAAISLTGCAIATSSLVFQTVTNNRILTPSVMGLDSLFLFMQTLVAFLFGADTLAMTGKYLDFTVSCALMVGFSLILCTVIFNKPGRNLFVLVLVGMVCGSLFSSLSSFMQTLIDPNEYLILQGKMFASFNNVNTSLLFVSTILIGLSLIFVLHTHRKLDVLSLGRENSINLGIHYNGTVTVYLLLISLVVAVSTALVGPINFLGVMVVNLSRQIFKTYRHLHLALGASLLSVTVLVGGQFFVERVFHFNTTVSVLANFVGGIYFIALLLKERRI